MSSKAAEKEILDRLRTEVWNEGQVDVVDELFADDFVSHRFSQGEFDGPEDYKRWVRECREAFPDMHVTFEPLGSGEVSCGVYTVTGTQKGKLQGKYLDIEPTGKPVEYSGLSIMRVEDGKFAEEWDLDDARAILSQLGKLHDESGA
ncbi:ester cyclase [Haladaptatus sp. DFWS20]|uniref:ester cyclase n=1 Tax=Haladaptatus sp. DFWS20 TaxID=3403467 RepID=UPI003EB9A17F